VADISKMPLKTGKGHVSFSEGKLHEGCSYAHKLKHIDNLNFFEENVYTNFGTAVHASCEDFLETREMKHEISLDLIKESWEKYELPEMGLWLKRSNAILDAVPDWLEDRFPGWETVRAEEDLLEPIPGIHTNTKFKGFIDAIIKHDGEYWLLDWKTASNGWNDWKRKDEALKRQLVFYNLFWSRKHNIDFDKINCGFVILNRDLAAEERVDFFTFKVTDNDRKKSLNVLNNMIGHVKHGKAFKIWKYSNPRYQGACRFCDYNGTEHCP
jgi:hypothetical protein